MAVTKDETIYREEGGRMFIRDVHETIGEEGQSYEARRMLLCLRMEGAEPSVVRGLYYRVDGGNEDLPEAKSVLKELILQAQGAERVLRFVSRRFKLQLYEYTCVSCRSGVNLSDIVAKGVCRSCWESGVRG